MWYQMFVQAVKVKGLFALICRALWSRVGAGEGQLPWRWTVVGRPWGLSSEQTALYKSPMWLTTRNSPIFVSEKAGTLCTEDQSSHSVLLGRSLVQRGSLSLLEPLKAEGGEDATEAEQGAQWRIFVGFEEKESASERVYKRSGKCGHRNRSKPSRSSQITDEGSYIKEQILKCTQDCFILRDVITTEHKSVPTFTVSKGNTDVWLEVL